MNIHTETSPSAEEDRPASAFGEASWPRWWRLLVIGLSVLVLCSCRSASYPQGAPNTAADRGLPAQGLGASPESDAGAAAMLPPSASTGGPEQFVAASGEALPPGAIAPWAPPGIARPWPKDEYIGDGGDHGAPIRIAKNWQINGLKPEDTIAHYDTVDGRTLVEPSNHVEIYAPKFSAVRRVTFVNSYQQGESPQSVYRPTEALIEKERGLATTALQPVSARGEIGERRLIVQQRNAPALATESRQLAIEAANELKAYENFAIIRIGQFQESQKAALAEHIQAAIIWSRPQGAHVILDKQEANEVVGDRRVQATYAVTSDKKPRLRLIKVASTDAARPGDIVAFTLRYDNTGSELIGNVTIVDNLTTRLEYLDNTASSTRKAKFLFQENDAGSLVLRWEILDPLPPGQGGLLRFKCRVR